jgi:phospholipid/cholesterol/gamma-HCH transport system ATP-binding protein
MEPAAATPIIDLQGVTVDFGGPPVLDALDLKVAPGEALVVLGSSGSGKSVLLKTIVRLLRPRAGSVTVLGERVDDQPEANLIDLRRKVSYCFQAGALFDSMTVAENLAYPLREHRSAEEDEIQTRVKEALERVGLADKGQVMPAELSGGMRKRAAFARGVITRPEVLLYDEPTAGLDPVTSRQINQLMVELKGKVGDEKAITTLMVTHDIEAARTAGGRVALIDAGKIAFEGTWEAAFASSHPLLKAFLEGQHHG